MRGSPFFDGVEQLDLDIAGHPGRLPCFYYDASSMQAVFPAHYGRLSRLLPDPRFVPARLAPGLGCVVVTCLEYRDSDIGAYNELAISIPLNVPAHRPNLPGRALWESVRRRQVHVFVHHLPVTTDVAMRGGIDYFNFPKFVAGIDFVDGGGTRRCRLTEGQEPILIFTGPRIPARARAEAQTFCHLWMDRQPQQAEFKLNQLALGISLRPGAATLELGSRHPIARELDRLLVSCSSLQYEYTPQLEAILHGPDRVTLRLAQRALRASDDAERRAAAAR